MEQFKDYKDLFEKYLAENTHVKEPEGLYEPISYILSIGGKRLRPISVFLGTEMCNGCLEESLPLALSIEVFHNFTLVHDDIMDRSNLRRNEKTVHQKWNLSTGILSGDAMMILAYQILEYYQGGIFKKIMKYFNQTALEVCEGQQMDSDFETMTQVSVADYLVMVRKKTAILLAQSIRLGGLICSDDEVLLQQLYDYGMYLGIAFQLQDDYLDAFGSAVFGKKIGGDILNDKKTFLYIHTLERGTTADQEELLACYKNKARSNTEKIATVTRLFQKTKADVALKDGIADYIQKSLDVLAAMNITNKQKELLISFSNSLIKRKI